MEKLNYTTDEDGFALLETEEGFLQYFRGYRIQLSGTPTGMGDYGSSYNINGHFSNVAVDCADEQKGKFINLIGLAHVYQAVQKYPNVIKQIKSDVKIFEQFMSHLLADDFNQPVDTQFVMDDVLSNLIPVALTDISELKEVSEWEGRDKGSAQIYVGIKNTEVYVVDADTLQGYSLDFYEFATAVKGNFEDMQLTGNYIDFSKTIAMNIVSFVKEYGPLFPPHFYVNKIREDSIKKSNLFSK